MIALTVVVPLILLLILFLVAYVTVVVVLTKLIDRCIVKPLIDAVGRKIKETRFLRECDRIFRQTDKQEW